MGEKDVLEKIFFDYPDVFAEVINRALYHGIPVLNERNLINGAVVSAVKIGGHYHYRERDIYKVQIATKGIPVRLCGFGIENQTRIVRNISERLFCYDAGGIVEKEAHNRTADNLRKKASLNEKNLISDDALLSMSPKRFAKLTKDQIMALQPEQLNKVTDAQYNALSDTKKQLFMTMMPWDYKIYTIVLYFGKDAWKQRLSLRECQRLNKRQYEHLSVEQQAKLLETDDNGKVKIPGDVCGDYIPVVIDVGHMSQEEVDTLKTDFRLVADFFVNGGKGKDYKPPEGVNVKHVDAFLDLMSVLVGNSIFKKLIPQITQKEDVPMSYIMEKFLEQAKEDADAELKRQAEEANQRALAEKERADKAEQEVREAKENQEKSIVELLKDNVPGKSILKAFSVTRKSLLKLAKENNLSVAF